MKHLLSVLVALILAGAVAAWLASSNLYGQSPVNRHDPVNIWREAGLRGLTYNESLALYRLRQSATAPRTIHPRLRSGISTGYQGGTWAGSGYSPYSTYPSTIYQRPVEKPFANVQQPPTAFERYWPLLIEGREDPKTGQIIWYFP